MAKLSLVAAISKNRVIGRQGQVPWYIPQDQLYFQVLTRGHAVIMGRKTLESMNMQPLAGCTNIVVTGQPGFQADGCIVVDSIQAAIQKAREIEPEEIFVVGGAQIYSQTIDLADKLYLTIVDGDYEGDAFFPEYEHFGKETSRITYSFTTFENHRN